MLFTIDDYKNALLFGDSFKTLSRLEPVKDKNDDFLFSSGRFSVVFKMQDRVSEKYHALKCFCHINPEHLEHSKEVADYLQYIKSPYLASYKFYEDEIWLDNGMEDPAYYPVILIDWVEGETMEKHLDRLCNTGNAAFILDLALSFDQMALWLLQQDFAHGDLKNDNILVQPNGFPVLVDYDGCFVPGMEGKKAPEVGTPAFQHPKRDETFFNKDLDDISILIISLGLHALATDTALWKRYNNGENMLLNEQDLLNQQTGLIWSKLYRYENTVINNRLSLLQYGLQVVQSVPGINLALKPHKSQLDFYLVNKLKNDDLPDLIPYRKGDKWGFCDKNKNIVISCKYIVTKLFSEGLAGVNKNGKWGFVDITGSEVIPCIFYDEVDKFSEGLAKVEESGFFGFIDTQGKMVIPPDYQKAGSFSEGLAMVKEKGKNGYGYIDKQGKEVIGSSRNGLIKSNLSRKKIYGPYKSSFAFFSEGMGSVEKNGKKGFVDINGNLLISCVYNNVGKFSEGLASVQKEGKWGYINNKGVEVIPCIYKEANPFFKGLAMVVKYGYWNYIDKRGTEYWED